MLHQRSLDAEDLVQLIVGRVSSPARIAVTGWPAVGKTTVSSKLASRMPGSLHIEAESWLHSMNYRQAYRLSGSSPRAYSISTAVDELQQLLVQSKPVFLGNYKHQAGRIVSVAQVTRKDNAPYVLDGTLFCLPDFQHLVEICLFIYPKDQDEWLEAAIHRDVKERGFAFDDAEKKNLAKRADMVTLQADATYARRFEWTISADGTFRYRLGE